jgi:hypothetical protein
MMVESRAELLAKLRQMNAATETFVAEQRKLITEADTFRPGQVVAWMSGGAAVALAGAAVAGLVVKLLQPP